MYELAGQVALVTGSSTGIGFGIAQELAQAGCRVVVSSRDSDRARLAAEKLQQSAVNEVASVAIDVSDIGSIQAAVETALKKFSRLDILVNNAGIHSEKIGRLSSIEDFGKCFDVNLFSVWRVTHEVVPHFRARKTGKIVNIASINGRKPWADTPAYSASKAAMINLTQSMAISLGPDNINVNAVCPGGVITRMATPFMEELPTVENDIIQQRILKRPLSPADIGHTVVFLVSSRSRNITGQTINVDGGVVMS